MKTSYETLKAMAPKALDRADGDVIKATTLLAEDVKAQPDLYRALMDPELRNMCFKVVGNEQRRRGKPVWRTPQPSPDEQRRRIEATAVSMAEFAPRTAKPKAGTPKVKTRDPQPTR